MGKTQHEGFKKLHKVKSSRDKRTEKNKILKNIKDNYKDIWYLEEIQNKK